MTLTMIYIYLAICISLIVFNIICTRVFAVVNRTVDRTSRDFDEVIRDEIEKLDFLSHVSDSHIDYLADRLKRSANIRAFDQAMENFSNSMSLKFNQYCYEIEPAFEKLIEKEIDDDLKLAYILYIAKRYEVFRGRSDTGAIPYLLKLLSHRDFYIRENALQLIYGIGDATLASRGLKILDQTGLHFNEKIISDGLIEFDGDKDVLNSELWRIRASMSVKMQVIILNYFRYNFSNFREEMFDLLTDKKLDDEIHYCAIRYFGRYKYEPAYELLMNFVSEEWDEPWQYKSISASALAAYPGKRTEVALRKALSAREWNVRINAAESLDKLGFKYSDFTDIFEGNDRFAREALLYYYDRRKLGDI